MNYCNECGKPAKFEDYSHLAGDEESFGVRSILDAIQLLKILIKKKIQN